MKQLKNCIKLSSYVKIYVPSTKNIDESFDNITIVEETLKLMSTLFGGATSTKSYGAWVTKNGNLVTEEITECLSFCNQNQLESHIDTIYRYSIKLKDTMKQENIAIEVNGEMYLI